MENLLSKEKKKNKFIDVLRMVNVDTISKLNSRCLYKELAWFDKLIRYRIYRCHRMLFEKGKGNNPDATPTFSDVKLIEAEIIPPPQITEGESPFTDMLIHYSFSPYERAALILSLMPYFFPGTLEQYASAEYTGNVTADFRFKKTRSGKLLPTGETTLFILAGHNLESRLECYTLFDSEHPFNVYNLITLSESTDNEPKLSGVLKPLAGITDIIVYGSCQKPDFGPDFPAKLITTKMTWEDLVIRNVTKNQIDEIKDWLKYRHVLTSELGMEKKLNPGYKTLFYGPPGTGKTLTATLLGKDLNKDVYRIDLSMVVSKYIGETEKNLAKIFNRAENMDWILFFDEADALFGKRTTTENSNDRYANQEVSYLLQRIEDYSGLVILASNFKSNIDHAFIRRFSSVIYFAMPKTEERLRLWQSSIPENVTLSDDVDLYKISEKYELSGAHVTNIVHHSVLKMLSQNKRILDNATIHTSVIRELAKEGKTL